jgi:uncharacterized protein YceK
MKRAAVWVGAAFTVALGGCGTILNMSEKPYLPTDQTPRQVYGGVMLDNKFGVAHRRGGPNEDTDELKNAALWLAACVDLPLSAVGDTVTLPAILWWQAHEPKTTPATSDKP